jgi:hypothetical protein
MKVTMPRVPDIKRMHGRYPILRNECVVLGD